MHKAYQAHNRRVEADRINLLRQEGVNVNGFLGDIENLRAKKNGKGGYKSGKLLHFRLKKNHTKVGVIVAFLAIGLWQIPADVKTPYSNMSDHTINKIFGKFNIGSLGSDQATSKANCATSKADFRVTIAIAALEGSSDEVSALLEGYKRKFGKGLVEPIAEDLQCKENSATPP
jgi:hypothetical protein